MLVIWILKVIEPWLVSSAENNYHSTLIHGTSSSGSDDDHNLSWEVDF
jgi:hypothetical protein